MSARGLPAASIRHVALIAPPWYPLPPHGYGGIELVVTLLARELRRLGHSVTVFGAEGSEAGTIGCAPATWGEDLGRMHATSRELTYLTRVFRALRRLGDVDVVHDHSGFSGVVGSVLLDLAPVVHTVHGPLNEPQRTFYESLGRDAGLVAISRAQHDSAPNLNWVGVVHNAVDVGDLRVGPRAERHPFLLSLARICPEKGQHHAIAVARRCGLPLVLAGKVEPTHEGLQYYRESILPELGHGDVVHLGNAAGPEKRRLLSRATALLAPITWPEPFGLSLVEAMASGTPVIAFRRGAVEELVVDGVTGFVVDTVEEMVEAVDGVSRIDPFRCAAVARDRFSPGAMAGGYLRVYEFVLRSASITATAALMSSAGLGDAG